MGEGAPATLQASPEHGNQNLNMSMDKPMMLINTEGIRGPQMKKCISGVKSRSPELSPELPGVTRSPQEPPEAPRSPQERP